MQAAVGRYLEGAEELLDQALGMQKRLAPHGPMTEFELPRRRKVRVSAYEEAAAVSKHDEAMAARSGAAPRLSLDMSL